MDRQNVSWFYESANDKSTNNDDLTSSFEALRESDGLSFDEKFESLAESYKDAVEIDIKKDAKKMFADKAFLESYKHDLLLPVFESYLEALPNDPHAKKVIKEVEKYWDTKVRSYTESASLTGFLPIATLEFPVLVKQFFSSILKDIIELKTTKTPNIAKHVRTTYLVNNMTGEEYEYPKCMFDGTWEKIWDASKGLKIKENIVPLTDGRLWKYDIIGGLTDGTPGVDKLSVQFKIIGIEIGTGDMIPLPGNGITVEFSTNGTLVNGDLNFDYNGTHIEDTIGGQVDFAKGIVSLATTSGQVKGVVFSGYLSNENNMRSVSVRERRSILRYVIEDGARWNMPFSMEEIEDAAALLDINYYNRMVDEITRTQEMQENQTVIKFLCDEFKKYNGIKTDIYDLGSVADVYYVDTRPKNPNFAGDPFKYIASAIQFKLKAIIHQIQEKTKLEGLSYVITGNSMATQLMNEFVNWKLEKGTSISGITVNGSYGYATDLDANVRVVTSNLYDPYTVDVVESTNKRELILHIYVYPTSADRITAEHIKYTSHLMTSQSQTAYQSPNAPGGAYNIVTATSRFKDISIQFIAADLVILNSEDIYGPAPDRATDGITGAPWS